MTIVFDVLVQNGQMKLVLFVYPSSVGLLATCDRFPFSPSLVLFANGSASFKLIQCTVSAISVPVDCLAYSGSSSFMRHGSCCRLTYGRTLIDREDKG